MIVHQSFQVNYEYNVAYTRDLFDEKNRTLARLLGENRSKVMIFVDDKVAEAFPELVRQAQRWAAAYPDSIDLVSPVEIIPGGEAIKKGWQIVTDITRRMMDGGICRHSYVMIVGGGAVLDAVGFAAAIFHRGVRQIRVPTTLLAQDDSGVILCQQGGRHSDLPHPSVEDRGRKPHCVKHRTAANDHHVRMPAYPTVHHPPGYVGHYLPPFFDSFPAGNDFDRGYQVDTIGVSGRPSLRLADELRKRFGHLVINKDHDFGTILPQEPGQGPIFFIKQVTCIGHIIFIIHLKRLMYDHGCPISILLFMRYW